MNPKTDPAPAAAKRVWEARTGAPDPLFLAYSESVADDTPFIRHDLAGSVAHVAGLHAAKLLNESEALALIDGLQKLDAENEQGAFALDPALEDVHMNIEAKLADVAGPAAAKVHTGRSRNDQVALCLTLFAREGLAEVAASAHDLSLALAQAADTHQQTPWTARTHGRPAQPATLGFLLAAHAFRFQALAKSALVAFDAVGTSPLGAGAVAGSTLPIRPEVSASLLGLRPLDNALLATGTRDTVLKATAVCAEAGVAASSLAADLLQLLDLGAYIAPKPFTSGSSLMPHKRNPDALELARGKGKALVAPYVAVQQLTAGMPLGYHRDFQLTKPHLVAALDDAIMTLQVLVQHLVDGSFDVDVLVAAVPGPETGATDAAEALVAHGVPFRDAYRAVAEAAAQAENGVPLAEAVAHLQVPDVAKQAALAALMPDAARRATRGGPAPAALEVALQSFHTEADGLGAAVDDTLDDAQYPLTLLSTPPHEILNELHDLGDKE